MSRKKLGWSVVLFCVLGLVAVACAHTVMSYCKIVALDVGTVNNLNGDTIGNVGGQTGKDHFLAGSGFYNNAGTLTLLDDATRTPQNVSSIAANGSYLSRFTLANTGTKANWVTASVSDELAIFGYQPSISAVGTTTADIGGYAPFSLNATYSGVTSNVLLTGELGHSFASETVTITHPAVETSDKPAISQGYGSPGMLPQGKFAAVSTTGFDLVQVSDMSGSLTYNGAAWAVSSSDVDASYSTAAPTSGGTVKITHATLPTDTENLEIQLTPYGSVYRVAVMNTGYSSFEVAFINSAGTVVTTPDTDMTLFFRKEASAQREFQAVAGYYVRRGPCAIKPDDLQNVSGGEVFVAESMDY